jgi:hypothetical protein
MQRNLNRMGAILFFIYEAYFLLGKEVQIWQNDFYVRRAYSPINVQ